MGMQAHTHTHTHTHRNTHTHQIVHFEPLLYVARLQGE
uniref:Uncharacterized protein n=1 Tax=Anguilla anguilla TaxID=7936 RepID=A0A0E9Q3L7_ANGAN